jgi:hypothetical protein
MQGKNIGIWTMVVQGTLLMIRSYSYHLKKEKGGSETFGNNNKA